MSEVTKDIRAIWNRLFDHRGFLSGEIQLALQEFEQKRGDSEVDQLFKIVENITEIKDTEIDKFKQAIKQNLPETNTEVEEILQVCDRFAELENRYKKDDLLDEQRQRRKEDWETFMDYVTTTYAEINSTVEKKQEDLETVYTDLEKKLTVAPRYP